MTFQCLKENNQPQIWIKEMKIVDYLMIGPTIRIAREILCLPYAGFFLEYSKSSRACKLPDWFKSYGNFTEWVDFSVWWSLSDGGSAINRATPSSFLSFRWCAHHLEPFVILIFVFVSPDFTATAVQYWAASPIQRWWPECYYPARKQQNSHLDTIPGKSRKK